MKFTPETLLESSRQLQSYTCRIEIPCPWIPSATSHDAAKQKHQHCLSQWC